ncbi:hypothetical protein [Stella sp.]|uniref:hypothetical protein n=1 Tax=Stella sp. TaxID=2912054 RepID=UPI0035AEC6D8
MMRSPQVALVAMAGTPFRRRAGAAAEPLPTPPAPPRSPAAQRPTLARGGFGQLGDTLRPSDLRPLPAPDP